MNSAQDLLRKTNDLISKIRRLMEKHEKLKTELKQKDDKIDEWRKATEDYQARIRHLEQEIASAHVSGLLNHSEENSKEVKRKLTEYLKQLDLVIAKFSADD
jgi:chromosome segregation ATPase